VWKNMKRFQMERLQLLVSMITDGWDCLDIGCNSGYMAHVAPNARWWGVDLNPELVAKAQKVMVEAMVSPAESLPYENEVFDLACLGEILEHVFDPEAVLREAIRVTGRRVIGSTPHESGNWGPKGIHPVNGHKYHVRCFTRKELENLLKPYGEFSIEILFDKKRPQMYVFRLDLI
jgi:ubiquinone/menaquinone biosynthesis C-methylase UbiE